MTQPMDDLRVISREEWESKKRHGYASIMQDGRRAILVYEAATGATVLEPVLVRGLMGRKLKAA